MGRQKDEQGYFYSSTEVSRFYGITVKGMEYYEEKGLVHPERLGKSKIRRFNLQDSYRMYFARLYHNCGLSIKQSLDILKNNTPDHIASALRDQLSAMRKEQAFRQRMMDRLSELTDLCAHMQDHVGVCQLVETGGVYRLFLRHFTGPHHSSAQETREYQKWNDLMPITNASLSYPLASLRERAPDIDPQIGMMIDEADFDAHGFTASKRVQYFPPSRAVRVIIAGPSEPLDGLARLEAALAFIDQHQLTLKSDAYTRLLHLVKTGDTETRYDEAWFPVE